MSKNLYDYLHDSLLFRDDMLDTSFDGVSDKQLRAELRRYRAHVESRGNDILQEAAAPDSELSAYCEGRVGLLPPDVTLKRAALYLERIILGDPLFPLTWEESTAAKSMRPLLGFSDEEPIAREHVVAACRYMKRVVPLVAGNFLKFVPSMRLDDPQPYVPLTLPENWNADILPEPLMTWLRAHAIVRGAKRGPDRVLSIETRRDPTKPLAPCRCIVVDFPGLMQENRAFVYHLHQAEFVKIEEESGQFQALITLPDEPPDHDHFAAWVFQSLNTAAGEVYVDLARDVSRARLLGSRYMTASSTTAELLDLQLEAGETRRDLAGDVAGLTLELDLDVVDGASFEALMEARTNYGESFSALRGVLERELKAVRMVTDAEKRKQALEDLAYRLRTTEVADARRAIGRLKTRLFGEAVVQVATAVASVVLSPLSVLGSLVTLPRGIAAVVEARAAVRDSPGYFLLRLKQDRR